MTADNNNNKTMPPITINFGDSFSVTIPPLGTAAASTKTTLPELELHILKVLQELNSIIDAYIQGAICTPPMPKMIFDGPMITQSLYDATNEKIQSLIPPIIKFPSSDDRYVPPPDSVNTDESWQPPKKLKGIYD